MRRQPEGVGSGWISRPSGRSRGSIPASRALAAGIEDVRPEPPDVRRRHDRRPGGGRGRLGADLLSSRQPEAPTPGITLILVPQRRPQGGHPRRCRIQEGGSAPDEGTILEKDDGPPTSEGLGHRCVKEAARTKKLMGKRQRFGSPEPATSEESSTTCSYWRPAQFRMDPNQSNVGEGSPGNFPGANNGPYQPPWNTYMYGYQGPQPWFPQGFQHLPPNVPMMNPSGYAPDGFQPAQIPNASKHNSVADVEEVHGPPARTAKKSKKAPTRQKLSNFMVDEDINLVTSWLEISNDPITSTGQKKIGYGRGSFRGTISGEHHTQRGL